jgi:uncharacterized protein
LNTRYKLILFAVAVALFFAFLNISPSRSSAEPVYPELTDYVNDYASMFDEVNKQKMRAVIEELEDATTAQIFVATVDSLQGVSVEEYAVKLFEKWGVGQAEKDNGLLILIAKQERRFRIEVGYGLEPVITDSITGRTIDNIMTPRFKKDEFGLGTYEAVAYLAGLIAKDAGVSLTSLGQISESQETAAPSRGSSNYVGIFCCSLVFVFFSLIITIVAIVKKRCPNCKKLKLKTIYKVLKEATYKESGLQLVIRDCSNCGFHDEKETKIARKSRSGGGGFWAGGGGSSGGGFSGGGGGFGGGGGGSSGGGGASGGW